MWHSVFGFCFKILLFHAFPFRCPSSCRAYLVLTFSFLCTPPLYFLGCTRSDPCPRQLPPFSIAFEKLLSLWHSTVDVSDAQPLSPPVRLPRFIVDCYDPLLLGWFWTVSCPHSFSDVSSRPTTPSQSLRSVPDRQPTPGSRSMSFICFPFNPPLLCVPLAFRSRGPFHDQLSFRSFPPSMMALLTMFFVLFLVLWVFRHPLVSLISFSKIRHLALARWVFFFPQPKLISFLPFYSFASETSCSLKAWPPFK